VTNDPLDNLQSFYDDCQLAPVPSRFVAQPLPLPLWLRLTIPFGGLTFGGLIALLVIASPSTASQEAGIQAARALTNAQANLVIWGASGVVPVHEKLRSEIHFPSTSRWKAEASFVTVNNAAIQPSPLPRWGEVWGAGNRLMESLIFCFVRKAQPDNIIGILAEQDQCRFGGPRWTA